MKTAHFLLPLAAAAAATSLPAATVTFTKANFAQTGSDYSLLDASGTILEAPSFSIAVPRVSPFSNTNPNPAATLNGIAFTPKPYVANLAGTYYATNTSAIDSNRVSGTDYTTATDLYDLAYDVLITNSNDVNLTVTLQNLTPGKTYKAQFIFSSDNLNVTVADRVVSVAAGTFTPGAFTTVGTGSDGTSDPLTYGVKSGVGLVTATFTADSATELFTTLSNTGKAGIGNSRVSLSALVISAVSVPDLKILTSSFDLAGSTLSLSFASQAGKTYQVTHSSDLVTWTQTGSDIAGVATQTSAQVPVIAGASGFYRVELKP